MEELHGDVLIHRIWLKNIILLHIERLENYTEEGDEIFGFKYSRDYESPIP